MQSFFPALNGDDAAPAPRRQFLRQIGSSMLGAASLAACGSAPTDLSADGDVRFLHGVASGDPQQDRVILWTRVTPRKPETSPAVSVLWQVASDADMHHIVASGTAMTDASQDYTVKIDADGLQAGRHYFYRFSTQHAKSIIGRTKTLPAHGVQQVRLAVFSCANYPAGYFNVYADAARRDDIDAALHIGDYIYEYDRHGYACGNAAALGRLSEPAKVLMDLDDYRGRYAQYRSDADLQALHASVPFIAVWDDHEFADDAWRDGAVDHKSSQSGPFSIRRAAAVRAYHDWMPIRAPSAERPDLIYRSFDFGKLVSLHMLDTRLIGRDQQLMRSSYYGEDKRFDEARYRRDLASPRRQMMGAEQMAWLERQVAASPARWQVLGQQVLMARMEYPLPVALSQISCADFAALKERARSTPASVTVKERACLDAPTLPCYLDSWDGYQHDRELVFDIMRRHRKNLVVLAGDSHNAWASDLHDAAGRQVGVEFATASVSSPGLERAYPSRDPDDVARMMQQVIAPLYYAQTSKRGYMVVTATDEEVRCDWRFVDTVMQRDYHAATERSLRTLPGMGQRKIVEC